MSKSLIDSALEKAKLGCSRNWGTTCVEFHENLKDLWIKMARRPKYSEVTIPNSKYSSTAYAYFFGSWTKTLIDFKRYLDEESVDIVRSIASRSIIEDFPFPKKKLINS